MISLVLVMIGGGIGAGARHLVNIGAARIFGMSFPAGTMAINIGGSFLMGLVAAWLSSRAAGSASDLRLFLATGILGGFTTFSAFSLEAVLLWERGLWLQAGIYVTGSVALSIFALLLALALGRCL